MTLNEKLKKRKWKQLTTSNFLVVGGLPVALEEWQKKDLFILVDEEKIYIDKFLDSEMLLKYAKEIEKLKGKKNENQRSKNNGKKNRKKVNSKRASKKNKC